MIGSFLLKLFEKFPEIPLKNRMRYFLAFSRLVPDFISGFSPIKGYSLNYAIQEGDIVLDAGAFTGDYTFFASEKVGSSGRVIALEPDSKNRRILAQNLKKENIKNVIIVPCGLWDSDTNLNASFNGLHSSVAQNGNQGMEVIRLDRLIEKLGLKQLDFIKMDIEGAEVEAIKGAVKTLKKFKPRLAIASYHLRDGKPTNLFLEKFLQLQGYRAFSGFSKHLTTYAEPKFFD